MVWYSFSERGSQTSQEDPIGNIPLKTSQSSNGFSNAYEWGFSESTVDITRQKECRVQSYTYLFSYTLFLIDDATVSAFNRRV